MLQAEESFRNAFAKGDIVTMIFHLSHKIERS